jgi:hypothetical protein
VIACRDERAVDDPCVASVEIDDEERGEAWHEVGDDAMCLRTRDREHRRQLAEREVRAEREADEAHPIL